MIAASNPQDETEIWDNKSASGGNLSVTTVSPNNSNSSAQFDRVGAHKHKDRNGGNDGDDNTDKDSIAFLFLPLIIAGCAVLAFTGFMVRWNRMRRKESNMMVFEGIEKTFPEQT